MGILDRFFKEPQKKTMKTAWKTLDSLDQLEQIKEASNEKPVAIFKHSISCGISGMVKRQLEREWDIDANEIDFYYLDLITYRPISNKIAEDFNVIHQSPQLIVIKDGQAVYDDSHYSISVDQVKRLMQ